MKQLGILAGITLVVAAGACARGERATPDTAYMGTTTGAMVPPPSMGGATTGAGMTTGAGATTGMDTTRRDTARRDTPATKSR